MTLKLKTTLIFSTVIALAFLGGLLMKFAKTEANPSYVDVITNRVCSFNVASSSMCNEARTIGTSTAPYLLSSAASSTLEFSLDNINTVQAYFWINGSTTGTQTNTKFQYAIEFSNNGVDWFPYQATTTGKLATSTAQDMLTVWEPKEATTSRTTLLVGANNGFAARYGRFVYKLLVANAQTHVEIGIKREN